MQAPRWPPPLLPVAMRPGGQQLIRRDDDTAAATVENESPTRNVDSAFALPAGGPSGVPPTPPAATTAFPGEFEVPKAIEAGEMTMPCPSGLCEPPSFDARSVENAPRPVRIRGRTAVEGADVVGATWRGVANGGGVWSQGGASLAPSQTGGSRASSIPKRDFLAVIQDGSRADVCITL